MTRPAARDAMYRGRVIDAEIIESSARICGIRRKIPTCWSKPEDLPS